MININIAITSANGLYRSDHHNSVPPSQSVTLTLAVDPRQQTCQTLPPFCTFPSSGRRSVHFCWSGSASTGGRTCCSCLELCTRCACRPRALPQLLEDCESWLVSGTPRHLCRKQCGSVFMKAVGLRSNLLHPHIPFMGVLKRATFV